MIQNTLLLSFFQLNVHKIYKISIPKRKRLKENYSYYKLIMTISYKYIQWLFMVIKY